MDQLGKSPVDEEVAEFSFLNSLFKSAGGRSDHRVKIIVV